ncbi:putative theta class glutathione s-transferase [Tilletiopsis washingtonensis]|uniref:Putative theta class glutathione s-transferase n=1 Tax=Tilletiopsis washingtonensis TaxID=58919 RepID=A0A316ZDW4_9BASI|nr:putative theta class glutathione s-transferase [Tilletiopsis washingtonensis]PWN99102.1 putative theta class glutathione s-transferase [Tilletiopsis washingtonensis]
MKPITLYTVGTPNGKKVSIFLEELKAAYPDFEYEVYAIDFSKNEQKEECHALTPSSTFLKHSPNGRIPAIYDPNHDHSVFETAAILLWLEKKYDPEHKFSWGSDEPNGEKLRSQALQWIFWVHGGVGVSAAAANHFVRYAPEQIQYGKDRYINETKRLYGVLEKHLEGRDWLVGEGKGKYSIADCNAYPWLHLHAWAGVPHSDVGPNVRNYILRNWERPAVRKGSLTAASPPSSTDCVLSTGRFLTKLLESDFEAKYADEINKKAEDAKKWVQKGMKDDAAKK